MKIALVAPLQEIVPPESYGGIELIVYCLAEGLVKRGHDVTLFARAESQTSAKLVSLGIDQSKVDVIEDRYISGYLQAAEVAKLSSHFDIINNHSGWRFIIFAPKMKAPILTSYHNLFYDKFHPLLKMYSEFPYTSISLNQQKRAPKELKFIANIYNGIDVEPFEFSPEGGDYLFWIGRLVEKKGAHVAIKVAKATNQKLIIAGPVVNDRPEDTNYFKKQVEPFIDNKQIVYVGPLGLKEKVKYYRQALAFLNPISWDEPFGLVIPEANATGTPAISYKLGAMTEIISEGQNGYLIEPGNIQAMIEAVEKIRKMSKAEYQKLRGNSRKFVESHFTISGMVDGYEAAYQKVLAKK